MVDDDAVQDDVETYHHLDDKIDALIRTTNYVSSKALSEGKKTLRDDEGRMDYEVLGDTSDTDRASRAQDEAIEAMIEVYKDAAEQHFGVSEDDFDGIDEYESRIMQEYINVTEDQLKQFMRTHQEKFFQKFQDELRPQLVQRVEQRVRGQAHQHLDESHKEYLIDNVGAREYIKPDNLRLNQLVDFYRKARKDEGVTKAALDALPDYALTEKAKKQYDTGLAYKDTTKQ